MKEESKKPIVFGIFVMAAIFAICFLIGFFAEREDEPAEVQRQIEITVTPSPRPTAEPEAYYMINLNASTLEMHKIQGEQVTKIKTEEVAADIFPAEDISLLSQGVRAKNYENAISIWENFIS